MWYAIVGPGLKTVSQDWLQIKELSQIFPYCKFRKFPTEAGAWDFINLNMRTYSDLSLYKYGNTFDNLYIQLKYIIYKNKIYFTFNTEHFGNIRLIPNKKSVIEYMQKCVTVLYTNDEELDCNLISTHLRAIQRGISMLGDFVDVDIVVPNYSIYYALTLYSGDDPEISFFTQLLKSRLGAYSISLNNKKVIADE